MGQFIVCHVYRNNYAWSFCGGKLHTARNITSAAVNFLMYLMTKLTLVLTINDPNDDA